MRDTAKLERVLLTEEPAISCLLGVHQYVEFVIPEHREGEPGRRELGVQLHHRHAVGTAIHEIADEDERPLGAAPCDVHTEAIEQRAERVDLAVHVADQVERTVGEPTAERGQDATPAQRRVSKLVARATRWSGMRVFTDGAITAAWMAPSSVTSTRWSVHLWGPRTRSGVSSTSESRADKR